MKILVLMPLDERSVYMSAAIHRELPKDAQDRCFAMPMFMEYLVQTKTSTDWVEAFVDSIISAKKLYAAAEEKGEDLIVIGNMPKEFKFDAVFNFQDIDEDMPYDDPFAAKMAELCKKDDILNPLTDLHTKEESTFTLHNCKASADFLGAYIQTDLHLDEIKAQYKDVLNFKDE